MKKSSIVYFSIACLCLLGLPVMAFILSYWVLIYLLPAAIFFWLSKDVCIFIAKKAQGLFKSCVAYFKNLISKNKTNDVTGPVTNKASVNETVGDPAVYVTDAGQPVSEQTGREEPVELLTVTDQTDVDDPVIKAAQPAQETIEGPVQMTFDDAVAAQKAYEEQAAAETETSVPGDSTAEETTADKTTEEASTTVESTEEASTADESTEEDSTAEDSVPVEAPPTEAGPDEPPLDEPESETGEQTLAEPEAAVDVPPYAVTITDEQIQEDAAVRADPALTKQQPEPAVQPTKEPNALLSNLKSGIGGVVSNVKKLDPASPFKNLISKTKDIIEDRRDTKSEADKREADRVAATPEETKVTQAPKEKQAPQTLKDTKFIQTPKEKPKVYDAQERRFDKVADQSMLRSADGENIEDRIKKQFDNLDMITTSAIAIMLSDTKSKTMSPYIKSMKKPDVRPILLKFCKDSYHATDIEQLNRLYNKTYYKLKIARYLYRVTVFVKRGIGDTLPRRIALTRARVTKNRFINKICETLNTFESVKYISALSGNEKLSDSKRNYKLDHLSENYKDALIYLMDLLLTCTCISKMLFVERMIKRMNDDSEFKKIIYNMTQSIDDHNLIISKSRPIYKQYYQAELGYINGDDLLYGMAITIMVNNAKKKVEVSNTDILELAGGPQRAHDFKTSMLEWLDKLAVNDDVTDIGTLILQKITLSIKDNYYLLVSALGELTSWENYYSYRVAYYNKERDKDRYLKGDFAREKEEIVKIK